MSSNKRTTNSEWSSAGEGSSGPSKRVRFGGNKAGTVLQEVDDSDLLEQPKARRGVVTVVEYNEGEDSSDDEDAKKKVPKDDIPMAEEEEEEDMFADPEDIARREAEKKKKAASKGKGKAFDASEIEGQDLNLNELDEEDYDSEGNLKIEAFNMKEELEEGGEIDETGNFIRKVDPNRFHDLWLEGVSRKEINAAKQAAERKNRQAIQEEKEAAATAMSEDDIYFELVNILRPSETVIEALQRLGGGRKSNNKAAKKKSWQKNKKPDESTPAAEPLGADDLGRKQSIEKLTDLCDKMMAKGHFDIYEETYEQIVRALRRVDIIPDDWVIGTPVPKPGEIMDSILENDPLLLTSVSWEYKWASPPEGQEEEVFGPFTGPQMKSWSDQGFFSQGILVRMVGDSTFEPSSAVSFE